MRRLKRVRNDRNCDYYNNENNSTKFKQSLNRKLKRIL